MNVNWRPRLLTGLREIADHYDAILCDVWGVLHDGVRAHPLAHAALKEYRQTKSGSVILISNAPWPSSQLEDLLHGLGIPRAAYDGLVTSGDLTRDLIRFSGSRNVFHLGPQCDARIFEGMDLALVSFTTADLVVCTSLFDSLRETVSEYRSMLSDFRRRALPMICANPDLVVERDGRLTPCAGQLAAAYEEIGGKVTYAGKPHRAIYHAAVSKASMSRGTELPRNRILAIGDSLQTDIAGARDSGISTLFVARGIHAVEIGFVTAEPDPVLIRKWLTQQSVIPNAAIEQLRWC
ncbi:TIGR01459 family HAD-type hydrolase [Methylobacterium gnaphalii]|uniref:TIGR01459 family HAD-type hydrolase n=1 Tax=Methylobacterium gnaphalii TaxID=1010610 RepID=UPI0011BE292F|nr:TIGR01459 family HAD-type hydrolase [Methylobacterium gnaphalii]GJD71364.1 hypothetical protein MMMDOFMJ_4320 [Methylobacterium gnaphalii]